MAAPWGGHCTSSTCTSFTLIQCNYEVLVQYNTHEYDYRVRVRSTYSHGLGYLGLVHVVPGRRAVNIQRGGGGWKVRPRPVLVVRGTVRQTRALVPCTAVAFCQIVRQ